MTRRAIKIHSLDEYGQPFNTIFLPNQIPVFFHNRPNARITKEELIDYKADESWSKRETVIQTIEEKKEIIENRKAFQHILTVKDLKEQGDKKK